MFSAPIIGGDVCAHGVARHPAPERFTSYAAPELVAAPLHVAGVCFNPSCGRQFQPQRDWQMYCCAACERASVTELRSWGHRMALPLLAWRLGKYEAQDAAIRARTNAARRYISHLQSAWLTDRLARAAGQTGGR